MVKPRRRRTGPLILAGLGLVLLMATLTTARPGNRKLYPPRPGDSATVFLVDNGLHSDIAIPREALGTGPAGRAAAMATAKPWVMVGFGDARFFIETGISVGRGLDALRAMFAPNNPSALRFDGLRTSPDRMFADGVRPVTISHAGLAALVARVDRSIVTDAQGRPLVQPSPPEADSLFVKSGEPFSILHLCNHWTAQLLDAAGVPTTPVIDTLPAGLKLDLDVRAAPLDKPHAHD